MTLPKDVYTVDLNGVKAVILKCQNKLILVDTGISAENAETILNFARIKLKMPMESYGELCLITHRHRDHVGGLKKLTETCDFKVGAHVDEAAAIEASTGVKVNLRLKDGDVLPYCGGLQFILVPGHTDGNCCIYLKEKSLLIAGDTLNTSDGGQLKPPKDQYNVNSDMAKKELKRLMKLNFDYIVISHGNDVEKDAKEKLENLLHTLNIS